jgi:hypothetical protein
MARVPHVSRLRHGILAAATALISAITPAAQAQVMDGFTWVDLKSDTATVAAVTKALAAQKYTALREIGLVGDQALVVTANRTDLLAQPQQDRFNVYDVSLKYGTVEPLLDGAQLRIVEWQKFYDYDTPELLATYDDCSDCEPTTFLTAFYIDRRAKKWRVRWPRDLSGAPLTSAGSGGDYVYALFMNVDERVVLDTWVRYPPQKKSGRGSEYLFEYRVDPMSDQGASRPLAGREASAAKLRLCKGEDVVFGIAGGQSSEACRGPSHTSPRPAAAKAVIGASHSGMGAAATTTPGRH